MTWLVIASQMISILTVLRYESKSNDVQENEDYVEMVQSDMNCISGHPTNHYDFIKANTRCIKCLSLECNIISFF